MRDVRLRALKHRGDQTFLDFLGRLHPDAFRIFEALSQPLARPTPTRSRSRRCRRSSGTSGTRGDLGRNMRGGSGLLPEALGESLGPIVRLGCAVESMSLDGAGVRISYTGPDGAGEIRARTAIAAVPAPHLPAVLGDAMTPEIRAALGDVTLRADGRPQHPHRRDGADAVGRPLLGADARPALQHVLQPRQLHARRRAEAGQRDHGLRRRPARSRAARCAPRTQCAMPSSPTST